MPLKYICHNDSDKPIFVKVRSIVQQQVYSAGILVKAFGHDGNELSGCLNGIQDEINTAPRINSGYLHNYIKVTQEGNAVNVYHKSTNRLICQIVEEK